MIVNPTRKNSFLVEYQHLRTDDEAELLKETMDSNLILPIPLDTPKVKSFARLEEVDAWYNEEWLWTYKYSRSSGQAVATICSFELQVSPLQQNHLLAMRDGPHTSHGERVLLMSLKAGGVGLNLTVASNVFLMDDGIYEAVEISW